MRCPQCAFHNLPNLTLCGRCGTSLGGGSVAAADVTPPRASKRRTAWRKVGYAWNDRVGAIRESLPSGRISFAIDAEEHAPSVPFWTLLVPGAAHRWIGFPIRGNVFLVSWLAFLLYGVFGVGLPFAQTALGLAISVHVSAVLDLFIGQLEGVGRRLAAVFLVYAGTAALVYYPGYLLVSQFVRPIEPYRDYGPLAAGDTALAFPRMRPQPGDVVVVSIDRDNFWSRSTELATLLGFENDEVRGEPGSVTVNGRAVPFHSTNQIAALRTSFRKVVPPGEALVAMSEQRLANGVLQTGTYALRTIPRDQITATIGYVAGPLARRGPVGKPEPLP